MKMRSMLALALSLLIAPAVLAQQVTMTSGASGSDDVILKGVRLEQKLNGQVPLDTEFRDENGKPVRLGDYFGSKPVMLVMIQLRCTMLCTEELNVLMDSLKKMQFTPGKEFNLLVVTIDPREQPGLALEKKQHYLAEYGRPEGAAGWHFLTGAQASIERLATAVGFHYVYDKTTDQYAHPDGVIVLTPHGRVARYFFRLEYPARDLRLGLVEAAGNKIASPADIITLLCFHYNPTTGKYALAVLGLVRLGAILTVLSLCMGIAVMKRRDALHRRRLGDAAV
jgi:protein SCO1